MDDRKAIRDLVATWLAATEAGDVEKVLELMSDDVVFLVAGQPPMRGRATFATNLRAVLKDHRIEAASDIVEIEVANDLAYCWNHLTVIVTSTGTGESSRRSGYVLTVLRKIAGEKWVVIRDANLVVPDADAGPASQP
jgi:uncharacterized protein (TIGR02246 family)